MKFVKSLIVSTLLIVFSIVSCLFAAPASKKVRVIFEDESAKTIKVYNFSKDNYFSIKDIAKIYHSHLVYSPITGKVSLMMNNRKMDIYIKSTKIFINNKKKRISLPTRYISGEVYVPAVFIFSSDFSKFTETNSSFSSESGVLTVERKTNISSPRYYSKGNSTQIVIELSENLPVEWNDKKFKDSKEINLSFVRGRVNEEDVNIDNGIVKKISLKNKNKEAFIKIVCEESALKAEKQIFSNPDKIVINITGMQENNEEKIAEVMASTDTAVNIEVSTASISEVITATESIKTNTVISSSTVPAAAAPLKVTKKKKLIVLDAGHGGDDPGAVGHNSTKEKNINLEIVKEVKKLFEEDKEFEVVLTRSDDTFIPLVERTSFANDKKADLFVSIHCNANFNKKVSGFEIYFLSEKASDEDAAATAILENSVVDLEAKPNRKQSMLQGLLWSMVVNEFINESSELCSFITGQVTKRTKIENRGVRQAGFFVLRGTQMPAVLVECAFLSNYNEEAKLKTKKFQRNIADAIFEGIKKYELRRDSVNAKK